MGLPSKQIVNMVGGHAQARNVCVGHGLWTLDGERTVATEVTEVSVAKAWDVVDVVTDRATFTGARNQELGTPSGWLPVLDATGAMVAWTPARKLCRVRLTLRPGYDFGYFVGATCADGTVGKNYVGHLVRASR
jgi:hypothetical protein